MEGAEHVQLLTGKGGKERLCVSAPDWTDRLNSCVMGGVQPSSKMLTPRCKLQELDIIKHAFMNTCFRLGISHMKIRQQQQG